MDRDNLTFTFYQSPTPKKPDRKLANFLSKNG